MRRPRFPAVRMVLFSALSLLVGTGIAVVQSGSPSRRPPSPDNRQRIVASYGKLPLSFEANLGQTGGQVGFLSRGPGYRLFLAPTEAVLHLHATQSTVVRMKLLGANPKVAVTGLHPLPGRVNYFLSNDPKQWHTNVPTYGRVKYEAVYPGIDLIFYGNQRELEYDFVVAPRADPARIRLRFEGAERVDLDAAGDLLLKTAACEIRQRKPRLYQEETGGGRQEIGGSYVVHSHGEVGFAVGQYDAGRGLVIDPVLSYSTYVGGEQWDESSAIAVDSQGNAYVAGYTSSTNFPTANPVQPAHAGGFEDAFVAKIAADGSALVYSTYLGGSGGDFGKGIAVDGKGNAYIAGETRSMDFPTANPLQPASGGLSDAFVAKIAADGSALVYSTYLGGSGSDDGRGIGVDAEGSAYATGETISFDFPTANPLQPAHGGGSGNYDRFVAKIAADGSALIYSTYLGGSQNDLGNSIAVDAQGNGYVIGYTYSIDFPTFNALQPFHSGARSDAFVTKIAADGSALIYSTYLGGSEEDEGRGIAVDAEGSAYLSGWTDSVDFPTTNPFQPFPAGFREAFVAKISADGSALVYSTYLGGSAADVGYGIAVDAEGNASVIGETLSTDFPTASPLQPVHGGVWDVFVTRIAADGSALAYSTYLGGSNVDRGWGIAVDAQGSASVTGQTWSSNFPTANAMQPAIGGGSTDAFVAKIALK